MSVATRADVQDVVTRVKQTLIAELRGGKTSMECSVRLAASPPPSASYLVEQQGEALTVRHGSGVLPVKPPPEQHCWQSGTRKA